MQNDEMFERTVKPVLDVNEKPQPAQWAFLSLQHLFAMFGATVLVPFLTGLPISAALLASGIGTLLYILITKAQIPAYLGSSFAFITPIITGLSTHSLGDMLVALFMSGVMYVIIGIPNQIKWDSMVNEIITTSCCWTCHHGNWFKLSAYCSQYGNV